MKHTWLFALLITFLGNAWAAERYEVIESVDVAVSADAAWNAVKDFAALDAWHPAVTKTEITEGEPPLRGTMRILTVGNGDGTVKETLTAYSDTDRKLSYVINATDLLPVKDYSSTINVVAINDSLSLIIWSADFLANPPAGEPDTMARDTMSTVYRAGLDNVKKMLEQ